MHLPIDHLITGSSVVVAAFDTIGLPWRSVRASRAERVRRMPGDELIPNRIEALTNAVTIRAPRRAVWPWLAQMGAGNRAGWYSYDFLDNHRKRSAEEIVPEWQRLAIGMVFPALPDVTDCFTLLGFKPERFVILGWLPAGGPLRVAWTFLLEDADSDSTRLIVRASASPDYHSPWMPDWLARLVIPIVHVVMERKQLLGIARRAEHIHPADVSETSYPPVPTRVAA
jgi:hypothetical protein